MEKSKQQSGFIWAYLLHLSYNMWFDRPVPELPQRPENPEANFDYTYSPELRWDDRLYNDILEKMADIGMNMIVLDLGDGVRYESHPDIAVKGAWSLSRLSSELDKMRKMGFEVIPKLNFSTSHDIWLGTYSRCVSTPEYYKVCGDLIEEVMSLFDKPRFFHIGMDEETPEHQKHYLYSTVRQFDLWWDDLYFYIEKVEKNGGRAWVWSDYYRNHRDLFTEKMPKNVLQSEWYYRKEFPEDSDRLKAYIEFDKLGYEQIPTGSNWTNYENFRNTVSYCKNLSNSGLKGFMQTSWKPTLEGRRQRHIEALDAVGEGIKEFESR